MAPSRLAALFSRKKHRSDHSSDEKSNEESNKKSDEKSTYKPPPYGLDILSEGIEPVVDIVAVHGLNGHREETWTSEKSNWLKDFLPTKLKKARILSWGYDSRTHGGSSISQQYIYDHARTLVSDLCLQRKSTKTMRRPIIFVAHSLGGIVVKSALIHSDAARPGALEEEKSIKLSTYGIIFMGTPHQGGNGVQLGQFLVNIASVFCPADDRLLKHIGADSEWLQQQHGQYAPISGDFVTKFAYETLPTPVAGRTLMVVPKSSAVVLSMADAEPIAIHADHRNMVKFSTDKNPGYKTISEHLLIMVQSAPTEVHSRWKAYSSRASDALYTLPSLSDDKQRTSVLKRTHIVAPWPNASQKVPQSASTLVSITPSERDCLSQLNDAELDRYVDNLDQHLTGTLTWFVECKEYIEWKNCEHSAILWISGQPGKGKTILASFISRLLSNQTLESSVTCFYYCSASGTQLNTAESLLRTLILQLVRLNVRQYLRPVKRAYGHGAQNLSRFGKLVEILHWILEQDLHPTVFFIIDAIDECKSSSQTTLAHTLASLTQMHTKARIKLLFTSQSKSPAKHGAAKNSEYFFDCDLERYDSWIKRDVELLVHARVESTVGTIGSNPNVRSALTKSLIAGAESTFLWVSMVLRELNGRKTLWADDIPNLMKGLPTGLFSLYRTLLESISQEESSKAAKVLHLVASSPRSLSIMEASALFTIESKFHDSASLEAACELDIEMVGFLLGSLIRSSESRLFLVHSSLVTFLCGLQNEHSTFATTYCFSPSYASIQLCSSCMEYLLLSDFDVPLEDLANRSRNPEETLSSGDCEGPVEEFFESNMFMEAVDIEHQDLCVIPERFVLFDYAATQWMSLLKSCEELVSDTHIEMAIQLFCKNSNRTRNWFRYFCFATDSPSPTSLSPTVLGAYSGSKHLLEKVLNYVEPSVNELDQSIYWASYFGYANCLMILLPLIERSRPIVVDFDTAIVTTTIAGHLECFKILLPLCDVNTCDQKGRSLVSLAAGGGYTSILRLLLETSGCDPNLPSNSGFTSLFYAVFEAAAGTIEALCKDGRTNLHETRNGRNIVSWAAEIGEVQIMEMLLEYQLDTITADESGLTPLMYAAKHGNFGIVKLLTTFGRSNPMLLDSSGRNALSHAAQQKDYKIVDHLLQVDPRCVDVLDYNGWSPLAWSLDPPGFYENTCRLLTHGQKQYNQKDMVFHRTPFSWAISYGYVPLVRNMLALTDLDINTIDINGRTPASHAASTGNVAIVQLLLSHADWLLPDSEGRCPIDWAELQGHMNILELLRSI